MAQDAVTAIDRVSSRLPNWFVNTREERISAVLEVLFNIKTAGFLPMTKSDADDLTKIKRTSLSTERLQVLLRDRRI